MQQITAVLGILTMGVVAYRLLLVREDGVPLAAGRQLQHAPQTVVVLARCGEHALSLSKQDRAPLSDREPRHRIGRHWWTWFRRGPGSCEVQDQPAQDELRRPGPQASFALVPKHADVSCREIRRDVQKSADRAGA